MCVVDKVNFEALICKVKKQYGSGFSKLYREMPEGEFVRLSLIHILIENAEKAIKKSTKKLKQYSLILNFMADGEWLSLIHISVSNNEWRKVSRSHRKPVVANTGEGLNFRGHKQLSLIHI